MRPIERHILLILNALLEEHILQLTPGGGDMASENTLKRLASLQELHAANERFLRSGPGD